VYLPTYHILSSPPPLNLIVDYIYKHILYYLRITVYVQALKSVIALRFEVPWAHTLDIAVSCLSLYISLGILEMPGYTEASALVPLGPNSERDSILPWIVFT
jgi:hypothetical protein